MKKCFFAVVIFLVSVSVFAQQNKADSSQGGTELLNLRNDDSTQVSSKKTAPVDSATDKQSVSDSSLTKDSAEQSDENGVLTLKISTDPTEAGIKIGDRDYGITPVTITDLEIGEHVLELSKRGHFRRRVTIQLDSAGADLHFALAAPASIFITSDPKDAQITFDGNQSGVTPFQSERMRPGDYPLSVSADGYESYETTVSLKSGVSDTLHIILELLDDDDLTESQTAPILQISQPEKTNRSLFNKEHTRTGIATIAFFAFIALLLGVEKTSY